MTTDTLTIDPVGLDDAGSYDVVVTNACGSTTSDPATLTSPTSPSSNAATPARANRLIQTLHSDPAATGKLPGSCIHVSWWRFLFCCATQYNPLMAPTPDTSSYHRIHAIVEGLISAAMEREQILSGSLHWTVLASGNSSAISWTGTRSSAHTPKN